MASSTRAKSPAGSVRSTNTNNDVGFIKSKDDLLKTELFYGDRSKLKYFLTQLKAMFKYQPSKFSDGKSKVLYAAMHLKGPAFSWFEPTLTDYLESDQPSRETEACFKHFANFEIGISRVFGTVDEERAATRAIHHIKQTGSAAQYYSQFQQVAAKLKWNTAALGAIYYAGLKDQVKDEMIDMPDTYQDMIDESLKIDNRLYERRIERGGWTGGKRHYGHSRNRADYGDPMQLDAMSMRRSSRPDKPRYGGRPQLGKSERERRRRENLCFNCGKSGHRANECKGTTHTLHMMTVKKDENTTGMVGKKADTTMGTRNKSHERIRPKAQKEPDAKKDHVQGKQHTPTETTIPHEILSWTACYDDSCLTHKSEKDGSGWYPTRPKSHGKKKRHAPSWYQPQASDQESDTPLEYGFEEGSDRDQPEGRDSLNLMRAIATDRRAPSKDKKARDIGKEQEAEERHAQKKKLRERSLAERLQEVHDKKKQRERREAYNHIVLANPRIVNPLTGESPKLIPDSDSEYEEVVKSEYSDEPEPVKQEEVEAETTKTPEPEEEAQAYSPEEPDLPDPGTDRKFIVVSTMRISITMVTNYWRRIRCENPDCELNDQHVHAIFDPTTVPRDYLRLIVLDYCTDRDCEYAPELHIHQGSDSAVADLQIPEQIAQRIWGHVHPTMDSLQPYGAQHAPLQFNMMVERLGFIETVISEIEDEEYIAEYFDCQDTACEMYFVNHKHSFNVDPEHPNIPIKPHRVRKMKEQGCTCDKQGCEWRQYLHTHFPKKLVKGPSWRRDDLSVQPHQLCVFLPKTRADHFVLTAQLGSSQVRVMIDSGANRSYASTILAKTLAHSVRNKDTPYQLEMADGSPVEHDNGWIRKELRNMTLRIGQHEEQITLDLVNIRYDVILGMDWLKEHNPNTNWNKGILEFSRCSCETTTEGRSPSKVPFARAIWVRPQGRYLAEMAETATLPSEYQDFEDLFKEREGEAALPQHQPWDHEIYHGSGGGEGADK